MSPQTVNAYYNPTTNEICFPAAKIGRNPLNDIVTVLRPNAITSSARGLRPQGDAEKRFVQST